MLRQTQHAIHKSASKTEVAFLYDPPVERWLLELDKEASFKEFLDEMGDVLKLSRNEIEQILWHGGLYLNKNRVTQEAIPKKIDSGTHIDVYRFQREPQDIPILKKHILFEDEGLIAIDKPAWLPVQSIRVSGQFCLEQKLRQLTGVNQISAIHRLDRQTSGVILFSKTSKAAAWMMNQFKNQKVQKRYFAIVSGVPENPQWEVKGYLVRDFNRLPQIYYRLQPTQKPKSRWSHSQFRQLGIKEGLTLIEAKPLTGRTHQIRVHLKSVGLPIVGDYLYGGNKELAQRTQLHAFEMIFPLQNKNMLEWKKINSPLPKDFIW